MADDLSADRPRVDVVAMVKALAGLPDATPIEGLDDEEAEVLAANVAALDASSDLDPAVFLHSWKHKRDEVDVDDVEERKRRLTVACRRAFADAEELEATAHFYAERGRDVPQGVLRQWRYACAVHAWTSAAAILLRANRKPELRELAYATTVRQRSHWRQVATNARRELRAQLKGPSRPHSPRQAGRSPRSRSRPRTAAGERSPPGSPGSEEDEPPLGGPGLLRQLLRRLVWP